MSMPEKRVKALFVSHASGLCGAERSLVDFLAGQEGVEPLLLLPGDGPLAELAQEHGIPVLNARYHAWVGRSGNVLKAFYRMVCNWLAARRLAKQLRGEKFDLVYVNTTVNPFGALLAKELDIPCVWHIREWVESFDFGVERSLGCVGDLSRQVIVNSEALKRQVAQFISPEKVVVVYNGPIRWERPSDEMPQNRPFPNGGSLRLVIVGTLYPNKGHEDAIRLTRLLQDDGVDARLDIVGEGADEYVHGQKEIAAELGVTNRIAWHGFVNEPLELIRSAHICLICSRAEAFGRVAVEAMSVGTPVISTGVGGLAEVMMAGETGLFYDAGNISSLRDAVLELTSDEKLYRKMVVQGVEIAYSRFTAEIYRDRLLHELSLCMERGQ